MDDFKNAIFLLEDRPYVVKYAKFNWMCRSPGQWNGMGKGVQVLSEA